MKKRTLAVVSMVLLLVGCAWEAGRAVVITTKDVSVTAAAAPDGTLLDAFHAVAKRLDMEVHGPTTGPGSHQSYEALRRDQKRKDGYFLVFSLGEKREFVIRTFSSGAPKSWADEAIRAFQAELQARGLQCHIHHT